MFIGVAYYIAVSGNPSSAASGEGGGDPDPDAGITWGADFLFWGDEALTWE